MLTAETKRRPDACRDVLAGKLPLPTDQIELITLALTYKFVDDLDEKSVKFGGKRSFFTGPLEKYRSLALLRNALWKRHAKLQLGFKALAKKMPRPCAGQGAHFGISQDLRNRRDR